MEDGPIATLVLHIILLKNISTLLLSQCGELTMLERGNAKRAANV